MKKLKRFFIRVRLRRLEGKIGDEFHRGLSLKIDKIIKKLEWEASARQ